MCIADGIMPDMVSDNRKSRLSAVDFHYGNGKWTCGRGIILGKKVECALLELIISFANIPKKRNG